MSKRAPPQIFRRSRYAYILAKFIRFPLHRSACTRGISYQFFCYMSWSATHYVLNRFVRCVVDVLLFLLHCQYFFCYEISVVNHRLPLAQQLCGLAHCRKISHQDRIYSHRFSKIISTLSAFDICSFSLIGSWEDLLGVKICLLSNPSLYQFCVLVYYFE